MRLVVQRVTRATVSADGEQLGEIGRGAVVLAGIGRDDNAAMVDRMADKLIGLRYFEDEEGRTNRSLADAGGSLLVVSQFTLYGDCRKGRRPSFVAAAGPEQAEALYEVVVERIRAGGIQVETGRFRAHMDVELVNDGPVTMLLDSGKAF